MAKKEMNLGGLLNSVTSRVEDAINSNDIEQMEPKNAGSAETKIQSNAVTRERGGEKLQQRDNAVTQERGDEYLQQRDNAATQERCGEYLQQRDNTVTQERGDEKLQQRDNAVTQGRDNAVMQERFGAIMPSKPSKKQKKMVPRSNGCTYYLEDAHIDAIDRIKCFNKFDKQDVVRTALDLFFASYMKPDGMGLNYEGVEEVKKYIYGE